MMRSATKLWCPTCEEVNPCYSINSSEVDARSGHRFYKEGHEDVQFFRRFRQCEVCSNTFETAEAEGKFLAELVELRSVLADLKANANAYALDAKKAAEGLKKLSRSLQMLKALE